MVEKKGGELADLKTHLRQLAGSQNKDHVQTKRELFKKIISYMTINIDVSSLFSEIIMATVTTDVATKKMLYHYITYHAHMHPELALLSINTLQKDCQDDDPTIRGLALRSLCSLRVANLLEYLTEPLRKGFVDGHPYVRRAAALGVLKVYHLEADVVRELGLLESMRLMTLHDTDAQVSANCLTVLVETQGAEALATREFIVPLLNRMAEYSEWSQCLILEVASFFVPKSEETYDIMNILEDRLQHSNSAIVLATINVFLKITLSLPEIHQQVYERIKAPLLTLISSALPEVAYPVVAHLHLLVQRVPVLFTDNYKQFYCRYNDPSYIKKLKLEMLTAIADSNNMYDIVTELSEYVADVDATIACRSVRAVGQIALETPDTDGIVERLLQFLELGQDHITAETVQVMADLLRRHPQHTSFIQHALCTVSIPSIQEPRARAAAVWMVGELELKDVYLLEPIVEGFEEEESAEVRLEILTACAKLFFKSPAQCRLMLGTALKAAMADSSQEVHDRGLLYYRALAHSPSEAKHLICAESRHVSTFAESHSTERLHAVFKEFNTLSVIYRQPSFTFCIPDTDSPTIPIAEIDPTGGTAAASEAAEGEGAPAASNEMDLLGDMVAEDKLDDTMALTSDRLNDLLGPDPSDNTSDSAPRPAPTAPMDPFAALEALDATSPPAPTPALPALGLSPTPVLDPPTFQNKWGGLAVAAAAEVGLTASAVARLSVGTGGLVQHMAASHIAHMASGGAPPNLKYFLYAQAGSEHFMIELNINLAVPNASIQVKADPGVVVQVPAFMQLFQSKLAAYQ